MQIPAVATQSIRPNLVAGSSPSTLTSGQPGSTGSKMSFSQTLRDLNELQLRSSHRGSQLVSGKAESLHQVVMQTEESSLALNLAVSVRNKAVEAYQEVMRMQV